MAKDFVFKFRGEIGGDERLSAVVRYDGDDDTIQRAARQLGDVTVEPAKDDAKGNRRVRLTGSNVRHALTEYARRANRQGGYTLGSV